MNSIAPLVLFVYNRPHLVKPVLDAVDNNMLASETDLFIFSDGAKNEKDQEKVSEVRKSIYLFKKRSKFKTVTIVEAEKNKGLANSIIDGVTEIIKKYGKVIVLEDDLLTCRNFLRFMNECLEYYEKKERVWSIAGTSYKMNALSSYEHDVYACYRGESCGWATWIDRWDKVDWAVSDYVEFLKDKKRKRMFCRGGQDMVDSLKRQMQGETDSWAIRWCYQESKENMFTIYPVKSFIENIGWDGSGTHSDVDRFHVKKEADNFLYKLEEVDIDENIMREFKKYYSRPLLNRILDYVYIKWKRLLG